MARNRWRSRKAKKEADLIYGLALAVVGIGYFLHMKGQLFNTLLFILVVLLLAAVGYFVYRLLLKSDPLQQHRSEPVMASNSPSAPIRQDPIRNGKSSFVPEQPRTKGHERPPGAQPAPPHAWSLELLNQLEWKRFEELCLEFFALKNFIAKETRLGADGGVDVQLFKPSYSTEKPFASVQCKAWKKNVGVKEVRALYGVVASEKTPMGIFMTTNGYTHEAVEFSKNKHLKLYTGEMLIRQIRELPDDKQQSLLQKITSGDFTTPTCPSCGIKMAERMNKTTGKHFWGCVNYPKCRQVLH